MKLTPANDPAPLRRAATPPAPEAPSAERPADRLRAALTAGHRRRATLVRRRDGDAAPAPVTPSLPAPAAATSPPPTPATASGPDVALSYAHADRPLALILRHDLMACGFTVGWDDDIAAGDNYRSAIQAMINAAAAVIVIWSPAAVGSEFVIDEATEAHRQGKLIATHVSGMSIHDFPLGLRQRQSYPVDCTARLVGALRARGIGPGTSPPASGQTPA